ASRMFEILDSSPTVKPPVNPVPVGDLKGDIELKNVSFEYEAGRQIIKKVSLTVEGGKMLGIVGKTGAGKSTIINLISRLYDVTDGEITIDGINIKNIAFEDLRHNIGVVSQETYLFMGTIADNIRYARPEASMDEVIEAAKSANAHDFIMKLHDGYDTVIGSGAVSLSGGEKQRISIARAIIQKPNILILDEATASMDTKTERKIQAAINAIKEGRTIISIAHRLSTLRDADMLCVIENGELCETGTHDELIRNKGKYFELYKLQADALKFIGIGEENAS
ncbi:MAG TPA: ATP-binding cassette domain-containing protein, partial [Oscillospiraceae bacterium]|nr:ATP-binding cassette domain-containing protein [Oscillospiraceae bacterium]